MKFDITYLLDNDGRIIRWPKKKLEKEAVLKYLHTKFEVGKTYTEQEVNTIITKWHLFSDYALLRRELFNHYLLERTPDGRQYWVCESAI